MDHSEALRFGAVEKYLLGELSLEEREQFEEHYFDCQQCALDVRATAAFLDAVKTELRAHPAATAAQKKKRNAMSRPAVLAWALAASLLVIGYQSVVVYPREQKQIALLEAPAVLPAVALAGGASRGGAMPSALVRDGQPFLLSLDIPTQPPYTSYTCRLYAPAGAVAWSVQISAQAAKDTVTITAPGVAHATGTYTLAILGNTGSAAAVELARYSFGLQQ